MPEKVMITVDVVSLRNNGVQRGEVYEVKEFFLGGRTCVILGPRGDNLYLSRGEFVIVEDHPSDVEV